MTFCTDTDLLHWEPKLPSDAAFASQTLISGTGSLNGTSFTIAAGSFTAANVSPKDILILSGGVSGCFPIAAVNSATALTVSVLYDQLFATDTPQPSPVGSGTSLTYAIRTFWAQRKMISDLLLHAADIDPEDSSITILNPEALRRPCVLGTLHLLHSALAAMSTSPSQLLVRADLYERMYRRAIRNVRLELDANGDGEADCARDLSVAKFVRV